MIIRSGLPDVELVEASLTEFVLGRAEEHGDRPALVEGATGRTLSHRQLAAAVRRAAAGLVARGVERGDVLALCSPNSPEFVIAFHAASSAGAVVTPINPAATGPDMARHLRQSGARWLITTAETWDARLREAAAGVGLRGAFVVGEAAGAVPFAALLDEGMRTGPDRRTGPDGRNGPDRRIGPDPDDVALLPFSSGTTGLPKGVVLTHRNLVASLCQMQPVQAVGAEDVLLTVCPLFHIYAMQLTMNLALRAGATLVTMPRFGLETFLRLVEEHRVTRVDGVPPIVLALAREAIVDRFDLSSVRVITSAAAPLAPELARACGARLGCRVKQAYGMTELGGGTHIAPEGGVDRPEAIGQALPGVESRVVDTATGADVEPGAPGELLIRTAGAMRCYLGNPEATAATIDGEGWLRTGDVVRVDAEGWFHVVDRVKELIKYKGMQVAPAELENVMLAHPAVADVAVVASPDPEAGEVPKAFVVLRAPAGAAELLGFVAARVAPYKRVRRLEVVDEIPKSPSGKVLRRLLVERERAMEPCGTGAPGPRLAPPEGGATRPPAPPAP